MSHFNMSWETATNEVSYQNIVILSASVPKYGKDKDKKKEKPKELFDILSSQLDGKKTLD